MSMIAEPLKSNLRKANIDHNRAREQLEERAAQQANNYISLMNHHIELHGKLDDQPTLDLFAAVKRIHTLYAADPRQS